MKQKATSTTPLPPPHSPHAPTPRDTRVGVTIRELADELGVAYQSVQRFIEPGGMPVMRWEVIRGRRYARLDMDECVRWARLNRPALSGAGPGGWRPAAGRARADGRKLAAREPGYLVHPQEHPAVASHAVEPAGTDAAPGEAPKPNPYMAAKVAQIELDIEFKKLRLKKELGQVLDKEEATRAWTDMLNTLVQRLDAVASIAAPEIMARLGVSDPDSRRKIEEVIEQEILRARGDIAAGTTAAN